MDNKNYTGHKARSLGYYLGCAFAYIAVICLTAAAVGLTLKFLIWLF